MCAMMDRWFQAASHTVRHTNNPIIVNTRQTSCCCCRCDVIRSKVFKQTNLSAAGKLEGESRKTDVSRCSCDAQYASLEGKLSLAYDAILT